MQQAHARDVSPKSIAYPEYLLRVLFTMFYPAVKMAVDANYPLDTVKDMMTLALWREAKAKHSTINVISLIFGKSTRTVKALSARFNKGGYFEETETNVMRRVEDLLSKHEMTADELAGRLPHTNEFDGATLAIRALLKEGRIEEVTGHRGCPRYRTVRRHSVRLDDDWEIRVDALREHLEAVTETIRQRFIGDTPDVAAARTFTFEARPEDIEQFREELFDFIRTRVQTLENDAAGEGQLYALYTGAAPKVEDE